MGRSVSAVLARLCKHGAGPYALGKLPRAKSEWPAFKDGAVYAKGEIAAFCWADKRPVREAFLALPDDARFRCHLRGSCFSFAYLKPHDPKVPASRARAVIERLQVKGWSLRGISREAGLAVETVERVADAREETRLSTETALLELARR